MIVEWDGQHCNSKAYGEDSSFVENTVEVSFKSGRKAYYKKNSDNKRTHSIKLRFDDDKLVNGGTEFAYFMRWYDDTLAGGANTFYFYDIATHKGQREYRLVGQPKWQGQRYKEVELVLEEV